MHVEPGQGAAPEGLGEPQGHRRGDAGVTVEDAGKHGPGYPEGFRRPADRQPQGLEVEFTQDFSRVWWVVHLHVFMSSEVAGVFRGGVQGFRLIRMRPCAFRKVEC